jgi:CheY-like chemotaxis protein
MQNSLSILLIEDDTIERMKFNRTLGKLGFKHQVIEAQNGEEALNALQNKDNVPNIIFLDLNMPRLNGIEFLRRLKNDPELRFIPTIILTTSNNFQDILEGYKIGIAGYVLKPLKYDEYVDKINKVLSYWAINQLVRF